MRKMKDSGFEWLGEIPEDWQFSTIGSLYELRNEKVSDKVYSPLSVTMKGIVPQLETAAKTDDGDNRKRVCKGDFVINGRSDRRGACGISPYDGSVSLINLVLIPRKEMNANYYNWLFHSYAFSDEFYRWGRGIVDDLWTTRWSEMKRIVIPVPDTSTQHSIADYLDSSCSKIDSTIAKTQQIIEKLKAYKQSVITEAVTKGLNPDAPMKDSGIEWIGEIPEHWSGDTLARRVLFEGGSQPPLENFIDEPREGYVRLIQNRDYKTSDYATYVPSHMVTKFCNEDDIMIGRYGPPVFVLHKGLSGAYNVAMIKAVPNGINKDFLWFYLQNYTLRKYVEASSQRTAGQSGVNPNIFKKYPIFLPDESEQQEIASYLDDKCAKIDGYITKKQEVIDKLTAYKKSLIFEVVTGKKEI